MGCCGSRWYAQLHNYTSNTTTLHYTTPPYPTLHCYHCTSHACPHIWAYRVPVYRVLYCCNVLGIQWCYGVCTSEHVAHTFQASVHPPPPTHTHTHARTHVRPPRAHPPCYVSCRTTRTHVMYHAVPPSLCITLPVMYHAVPCTRMSTLLHNATLHLEPRFDASAASTLRSRCSG